jgi:SAM-dependent methyltransferase
MNEARHWNALAPQYDAAIFDVFASDQRQLLPQYFTKYANADATAVDFGCGNGKAFKFIAHRFKKIIALDISRNLLKQAQAHGYPNVTCLQTDLAKRNIRLPKVDFVFSCNVIMLPEVEKNTIMLQNVYRALKPGGSALLVVPSTESILFSAWRLMDWYNREGIQPKNIPASELSYFKGSKQNLLQGLFYIDNVLTKHYAEPELEVLLKQAKLQLTAIEKLEYAWSTEFSRPPRWMQAPYPWDWLVACERR